MFIFFKNNEAGIQQLNLANSIFLEQKEKNVISKKKNDEKNHYKLNVCMCVKMNFREKFNFLANMYEKER